MLTARPFCPQEFSHPVESLALTVEEVMGVRRVLVKAEMERFLHDKELASSLRKGKVSWPGSRCSPSGRSSGSRQAGTRSQGCFLPRQDKLIWAFSYRFAAAAEPGSRCSPGHPPVSFARGERL